MYPGVLIPVFTDSEVLAPSCRSTLKGINTPLGTSAVLRRDRGQVAAPTGDFRNDRVNIISESISRQVKMIDSNSSLPRWLQLALGLSFLPVCVFILFMSVALLIGAVDNMWYVPIGIFSLLAGLWMTALTFRLILNKQDKTPVDEKLPPWALMLFALYFISTPILSLVTGVFFENPVRNIILLPVFIGGAIGAYRQARINASKRTNKYFSINKKK